MAQSQIPLLFPLLAKWFAPSLEVPAMFLSLACFAPLYAWSTYRTVGDTCDALGMAHFYTIPPQKPKASSNSSSDSTPTSPSSGKSAK